MADDNAVAEVFVYTGVGEGAVVPKDVIHVRIDPTVLAIPDCTFLRRFELREFSLTKVYMKLVIGHSTVAQR